MFRLFALSLLVGCPYVGQETYLDIRDQDGDQALAVRFGGTDCQDLDPSITNCDVDGDDVLSIAAGSKCATGSTTTATGRSTTPTAMSI